MKTQIANFLGSMNAGARALLLVFAFGFPIALIGHYAKAFEAYEWLGYSPALIWKGQVWRLVTYGFLPGGVVDWAVSLFWLITLVCVLGRNWSGRQLWAYCLLSTVAASLFLALVQRRVDYVLVGNGAMILALIAAWNRLYARERIILLGIGEMSVHQAAIIVAIIELLILFFCLGWLITLGMVFGGAIGWLYLIARGRHALNRHGQQFDSARIARLEL